jgi:hypothetical protein
MRKNYFLIIGTIIILASGLIIFSDRTEWVDHQKNTQIVSEDINKKVILVIDTGENESHSFETNFKEGMTVFSLLNEATENFNLFLKTKIYDAGIFVEGIGEKENGQHEKYWFYYVNEEMPMVSTDKKEIKPGDKVEFKFEESLF